MQWSNATSPLWYYSQIWSRYAENCSFHRTRKGNVGMQMSDKYTHESTRMAHPLWTQSYILFLFPLKDYGYDKLSLLKVAQMYLSFAAWKVTFLDNSSQVLLKKQMKWLIDIKSSFTEFHMWHFITVFYYYIYKAQSPFTFNIDKHSLPRS